MARDNEKRDLVRLILGDARKVTFAALLVLSLAVGGTLAYYSASSNVASNNIASVSAPVPVIVENDDPVTGNENDDLQFDEGDTPGTYVADKKVQVRNDGDAGFLRVKVTLPQLAEGDAYAAYNMVLASGAIDAFGFAEPVDDKVDLGAYTLVFDDAWDENWAYKDGWFYYRRLLPAANDTTTPLKNFSAPLLSQVTTTEELAEGDALEVGIIVETLEYNGSVKTANTTWGVNYQADGPKWPEG